MTIEQVRQLHSGDEVFWNDPDDGICSKYLYILTIEELPQLMSDGYDYPIRITDVDGGELECFACELT